MKRDRLGDSALASGMHGRSGEDNVAARQAAAGPVWLALGGLLAANVLLAIGPWMVRLADVGPVAAGFWRLTLAAPLLAVAASRERASPHGRVLGWLLVGGAFFAADLASWHAGLLRTRLANATLLGNAASFLYPVYGFLAARRWPNRAQSLALALAAAGVTLLVGRSIDLSARNLAGDLLCLLAGTCYAGYFVAIERTRGASSRVVTLATATVAGMPLLLAASVAFGEVVVPHRWWPLVLLSLGSQVAGQGLMVGALRRFDPLVVGLALLTQPVVAGAIGWIVYGERLGAADFAGAAMIGTALVLVRRRPRA